MIPAPVIVLVLSSVPSTEGTEAVTVVAGAVQNLVVLAHAAGLATQRIYSPHLVPEAVLDYVGERCGPEVRRGDLVAMMGALDARQTPRHWAVSHTTITLKQSRR